MNSALSSIMNTKYIVGILLVISSASYGEGFDSIYNELDEICIKYPDFRAVSISLFEKETASPIEIRFYELTSTLHRGGSSAIDKLLAKRAETQNKEKIRCIDEVLNTWPG